MRSVLFILLSAALTINTYKLIKAEEKNDLLVGYAGMCEKENANLNISRAHCEERLDMCCSK